MTAGNRIADEVEERRLVEGLRQNDKECLATIYDAHSGMAYALALQLLRSAADAEDVVQEAFIALWRQAQRIDPTHGIRGYLLTIVHNKAIDKLRQRGRRREGVIEPALALAASDTSPEDAATRADDRDHVRRALNDLPAEQLKTLDLVYYRGLSMPEAATQLQIPLGTVKSRVRLALGHLRQRLAEG